MVGLGTAAAIRRDRDGNRICVLDRIHGLAFQVAGFTCFTFDHDETCVAIIHPAR
jgi:hypothetical protein